MITSAFINLWGQRIGAVVWDPSAALASFEYTSTFTESLLEVSPLKMPLSKGKIYSFPELKSNTTFKGLPGLLADALPDKYGNELINAWLSLNGRAAGSLNPVEMLCFIGKRSMGALEFDPVSPPSNNKSSKLEIDSLIETVTTILSSKKDYAASFKKQDDNSLLDILRIGTSAGGARAKALIAWNEKTNEVRSGQTDTPVGFEQWIIKFDGVTDQQSGSTFGYGRVEMAYALMAKAAGIYMMECRLLEENGRAHFMTKRFDRKDNNEKIHMQSFCALNHFDFNDITSYSYEQLFETMRSLHLPYADAEELYRRMVFNVMARNCDDHTKNFAFLMDQSGKWRLSPAFDICHAYRPGSLWVSQHSLSINGKRKDISREDLLNVAKNMNIKKPGLIIDSVREAISEWESFAREALVDDKLKKAIKETLILL